MSPRRNWDSPNPSPASACTLPPPHQRVGGHTRLRLRGWGSSNSGDWRKSLALCLYSVPPALCKSYSTRPHGDCTFIHVVVSVCKIEEAHHIRYSSKKVHIVRVVFAIKKNRLEARRKPLRKISHVHAKKDFWRLFTFSFSLRHKAQLEATFFTFRHLGSFRRGKM